MTKISFFIVFFLMCTAVVFSAEAPRESIGAALYKKSCSGCHPDAGKLKSENNIIELMRHPPAAMPAFGQDKISDQNAQSIAEYIKLQIYYKMSM